MSRLERRIKVKIDWNKPVETINGEKLLFHHILEVFEGKLHILTFDKLSNPIVYNHEGRCLGQLNNDYLSDINYAAYEIKNTQSAEAKPQILEE